MGGNATVVMYSTIVLNPVRLSLLQTLLISAPAHVPVAILVDDASPNSSAVQQIRGEVEELARQQSSRGATVATAQVIAAPRVIGNLWPVGFNSTSFEDCCPGKFQALRWCVRSGYELCWHIEDDSFIPQLGRLVDAYRDERADLLSVAKSSSLPPFVYAGPPDFEYKDPVAEKRGWCWTKRDLQLAGGANKMRWAILTMYRMSRRFASAVLRHLEDQQHETPSHTSHCEIMYPHVLRAHHLTGAVMEKRHIQHVVPNAGPPCFTLTSLQEARAMGQHNVHPVKFMRPLGPASTAQALLAEDYAKCLARAARCDKEGNTSSSDSCGVKLAPKVLRAMKVLQGEDFGSFFCSHMDSRAGCDRHFFLPGLGGLRAGS